MRSFSRTGSAKGAEAPRHLRRPPLATYVPRDDVLAPPASGGAWGGDRPSQRSTDPAEASVPKLKKKSSSVNAMRIEKRSSRAVRRRRIAVALAQI